MTANFTPLRMFCKTVQLFWPNWFDAKAQWVIGCFWSLFWPILPNWFSGWWQYISGAGRALMDDGRDEIGEGAQPPPTIYQGLPSRLPSTTQTFERSPKFYPGAPQSKWFQSIFPGISCVSQGCGGVSF